MIEIHLYKSTHQNGINEMMRDIANEFELPISGENKSKHQSLGKHWVAMNNSEIVGTIVIYKIDNASSTLKNMFVKKEYRGSAYGVAQSLLSRVYDWCNSEHIKHIYLGTMNQFKAAQKFYKKNQFKKVPKNKLPKNFTINPVDDVFYKKVIQPRNENFIYRKGHIQDVEKLKELAVLSWSQFKEVLTKENWEKLLSNLSNEITFLELLQKSKSFICETENKDIIGMAFLVPSGNPTEIFDESWSSIRFVTVNPLFGGRGIGKELTKKCIDAAIKNNEHTIALHTSIMMEIARHIYESLGFKVLQELEPRLGKKYWLYLLNLKAFNSIDAEQV